MATVIRPLEQIYDQPFDIVSYGVIIKPSHGSKILGGEGQRGFSPKAEYIFRKQLEEADFVILNRIDELTEAEVNELTRLLTEPYAKEPIDLVVNARVAVSPEELETLVRSCLADETKNADAESQILALQCFRPGRPVPTHRLDGSMPMKALAVDLSVCWGLRNQMNCTTGVKRPSPTKFQFDWDLPSQKTTRI